MAEELFTFDRTRLALVSTADPTGYLGSLEQPGQACRAVFLAAEVDAIRWNDSRWPDLEFGVWCDDAPTQPGRRRRADSVAVTELTTWLQLRPSWPQLGGPSIPWPPPNYPEGPAEAVARLAAVVHAAVEALNSTYRRTIRMATALTAAEPAVRAPVPEAPETSPTQPESPPAYPDMPLLSAFRTHPVATTLPTSPRPLPLSDVFSARAEFAVAEMPTPTLTSAPDDPRSTFVTTGVAGSERDIADVLARLVDEVVAAAGEQDSLRPRGIVQLDHAVTPLPASAGNGTGPRYLVSLTAVFRR